MSDVAARPAPNLLANGWVKSGLILAGIVVAAILGAQIDASVSTRRACRPSSP
jgi:branched-chain amino acid transport system permease protein